MKIGLFGGSFDPVHFGHLLVARAAREEAALDRVFFIPAAQSPFKPESQPAPARERLRLLRLALAGEPRRKSMTRKSGAAAISYTIDTVREYREEFPGAELFYLIGADQAAQLHALARGRGIGAPGRIPGHPAAGRSRAGIGRALSRAGSCAVFRWECRPRKSGRAAGGLAHRAFDAAGGGGGDWQKQSALSLRPSCAKLT